MQRSLFVRRQACPACASGNFTAIYQCAFDQPPIRDYLSSFYSTRGMVEFEHLEDAIYLLCECQTWGLVFQQDIPGEFLMERLYEHWIDPQKAFKRHQVEDSLSHFAQYAQEIMRIIAYFQRPPADLNFLDFGMGWGRWTLMAKAFGCNAVGLEVSEARISYANSQGIRVIVWDEIPQRQFDFINTEQVFEHIPEPLQTLRHLGTGLKIGGLIKISVPGTDDIKRRLSLMDWDAPKGSKNSLNAVAPLEHINCFRRVSLLKMATIAGFEEVQIPLKHQYRYTTNWHGVRQVAKNLLLPLYRNFLKRKNYLFLRKRMKVS